MGRVAGPTNAFCMLNATVIVGSYKCEFTHGPLWKRRGQLPALQCPRIRQERRPAFHQQPRGCGLTE